MQTLSDSSSSKTSSLQPSRIPSGRPSNANLYPLNGQLYCPRNVIFPSVFVCFCYFRPSSCHLNSNLPPSCHLVGHARPSCLQDRNLGPTWPNLAPSWPHLRRKNGNFVWEWWYFLAFRLLAFQEVQDSPKMTKMVPRWPPDGPKSPPRAPKETPRRCRIEPLQGSWEALVVSWAPLGAIFKLSRFPSKAYRPHAGKMPTLQRKMHFSALPGGSQDSPKTTKKGLQDGSIY